MQKWLFHFVGSFGDTKKALLIPTPGQPEQEYLGRGLMAKSLFLNVNQDDLNLSKHVLEAMAYPGYLEYQSSSGLEFYLDPLVNKLMRNKSFPGNCKFLLELIDQIKHRWFSRLYFII